MWNYLMKKQDIPKELELFYVALITVPLYTQWEQFIIVQVTLTTPYHQFTSNFMLYLKRLRLNLLNILTLSTLKINLGNPPTKLKKIMNIFKLKISKWNLIERGIFLSQLYTHFNKKLRLFISVLVMYLLSYRK